MNKRIYAKLRAILSKTMENGCTEAEALAALETAQRLAAQHDVDLDELDAEMFVAQTVAGSKAAGVDWTFDLAFQVSAFTGCFMYRDGRSKQVIAYGRESSTIFADWLVKTLNSFVNRQALNYLTQGAIGSDPAGGRSMIVRSKARSFQQADMIRNFGAGVVLRINQRLRELCTEEAKRMQAEARADLEKQGKEFKKGGSKRQPVVNDAFRAGMSAGDGAAFNRPVNGGAAMMQIGRA
ncbi:MAG: DUF2786 domain-containing protein [Beijerinckiaceae bacterium]